MSFDLLAAIPRAPAWRVDYAAIEAAFAWARGLRSCPQDPVHHAEGDVGLHTEMVVAALTAMPAWRALDDAGRRVCFLACLLHDVAKPWTTAEVDGRLTARGHSSKGAVFARRFLWELGLSWREREQVCGLILHHQVPFFLVEKEANAAERRLLGIAEVCRCDFLAVVAEADMRGRICADQERLLLAIDLFRVFANDVGVFAGPFAFDSDHSRFRYFRDLRRSRFDTAFDDTRCTVTLLSGLPASGKDHWVAHHGDIDEEVDEDGVISLDDLREELGLEHGGGQRALIEEARERLKGRLRLHRDVVWNATSLSRDLRSNVIAIADDYGARVRIVCCEAAADVIAARNRARESPVPAAAIERMLSRWEFPARTEAHVVEVATGV